MEINREKRSRSSNNPMSKLPKIEHPLKRRSSNSNENSSFDIRGRSRNGFGNGELIRNESLFDQTKSNSHRFSLKKIHSNTNQQDQIRLPIFGSRPESILSNINEKEKNEKETPRTIRIRIDELETKLREKVRLNYIEIRTKYRHASHSNDSNPKISRSALQHLIASIFGTQNQISRQHMDKLFERLNLNDQHQISFEHFIESLFENEENLPNWFHREISSRKTRNYSFIKKRTATQMFLILKENIRTKNEILFKFFPSLKTGQPSRIFKAQFYNSLIDMGYQIDDQEFDKLWEKFDTDDFKALSSEKFLKCLQSDSSNIEENQSIETNEYEERSSSLSSSSSSLISKTNEKFNSINNCDQSMSTPRITTSRGTDIDENQIQKWLNYKFPKGFSKLEKSLERLDTKQMGTLPKDLFLNELKRFGLKFEPKLFDFFLKRLDIDLTLTNNLIPYNDVINAFKQRSDPTKKRLNSDNPLSIHQSKQILLEKQIEFSISLNYEKIKSLIYQFDFNHQGFIHPNDLRKIIEDLLEFTFKPDEFYQYLKKVPTNENGMILYQEYLKQVLDRALIQQENNFNQTFLKNSQWELIQSSSLKTKFNPDEFKRQRESYLNHSFSHQFDFINENNQQTNQKRSIEQLQQLLKTIIRTRSKQIEEHFKQLDRSSYSELNKNLLSQLFQRLSIDPKITDDEIDLIWSRCHLKENGNLDFYQFLREFGYTKRSAHFPNAKQNPPKRGDADFLLTSRKLYGDSVLVQGTTLNAIRSNWNELKENFIQLDPYRTGFVQSDEFDQILIECSPIINDEDLRIFKTKFQSKDLSRINYVQFLKSHFPTKQWFNDDEFYHSSKSNQQSKVDLTFKSNPIFIHLIDKLREKFHSLERSLKRSFKQLDFNNTGFISIQNLKVIFQQNQCFLNDEEYFLLLSQLDPNNRGTIDYQTFLRLILKKN